MSNSADYVTKTTPGLGPGAGTFVVAPVPLWRRGATICYDLLLLAALFFLVGVVAVASNGARIGPGSHWFQALLAGTAWLYFCWCWVHGGQTVAMRAWKVRLVRHSVTAPLITVGWRRATVRFIAAWLPALPLLTTEIGVPLSLAVWIAATTVGLGFAAARLDPARRCWYDLLAGTCLVSAP